MNFYKRYIGDYARDTAHLSLMEHGAYTLLLDTLYSTGKLPGPVEALCRICRASSAAEKRAVTTVANQFFPVNGDGSRHNNRADREIGAYQKQADTNRIVAVERWAKRRENESYTNRTTNEDTNRYTKRLPNQKPDTRKNKHPIPDGFAVSDRVKAWAEDKGHGNLEAHLENFIGVCKAKGYRYVDWDQAFMNAIAKNWANLGKGTGGGFPL